MAVMHPALFHLARLRVRGLFRRLLRGIKTPKGAISFMVGFGVFALWLLPPVLITLQGGQSDPTFLRAMYPLMLLGLALMTMLTSAGERAIYFSPAEVAFLFAGPFGRRELLVFKTLISLVGIFFAAFIFTVMMFRYGTSWYAAYVGAFLSLLFIHLATTSLMLLAEMVEERSYTRARKAAVFALVIVGALAVYPAVSAGAAGNALDALRALRESWALRYVLLPLDPFAQTATAESLSALAIWGCVALGINALFFLLILYLDAEYRDTAVAVSQKLSRRIDQMRRGGLAGGPARETATHGIPRLPWMGGAGPIVWRQMTNASRNSRGLLMMIVFIAIGGAVPFMMKSGEVERFWHFFGPLLIWVTILLTMSLRFDFRSDIEQMDWLKVLPLRPWAMVAGQLVVPVLMCTVLQAGALAVGAFIQRDAVALPIGVAFLIPVNLLLFGIENILFLLFPTRHAVFSPGDFQMFGRQLLMMFLKMLVVSAVAAAAAAIGIAVYFVAGRMQPVAWGSAWAVFMMASLAVVPLGAWVFRRFDVSLDIPD